MRTMTLVTLSIVSACSFRVPRGIPVHVSGRVTARADLRTTARVDMVVVPLQGAPVTEFFGIPLADARELVFVLDISGSMSEAAEGQLATIQLAPPPPPPAGPPPPTGYPPGHPPPSSVPSGAPPQDHRIGMRVPTKIEVAQAELIDAIAKLPAGTRLNVLIFSDEIDAYAPSMVVLDDSTRADLISFVRDMRAAGATALQPALRVTFLLNTQRVVLLSDGLGNIGGGREDILRDVREAVRGGVRIDAIGIGRGQDRKLLSAVAAETGGLYQAL